MPGFIVFSACRSQNIQQSSYCRFFLKPAKFFFHSSKNHSISVQPWLSDNIVKEKRCFPRILKGLTIVDFQMGRKKRKTFPCYEKHSVLKVKLFSNREICWNILNLFCGWKNLYPTSISFGSEAPKRFICIRELHLPPYTEPLAFCLCATWKAQQWLKSPGHHQKMGKVMENFNNEKNWAIMQKQQKKIVLQHNMVLIILTFQGSSCCF